ncbi:MAG TPA: NAD(+)--rifampin ADP-ribosyltransferase [Candidatus Janibacter merdipullorum]|nr:NAD(+)--rifampin ADP-ribosyltransferase [Candidatus Janibacter merdipullorum]
MRNPTRSYRSSAPLRVVAAVSDWTRLTPEDRQSWRERLGTLRQGEILG